MMPMHDSSMKYELTAQPIHENGTIGFENQNPILCVGSSLASVFALMPDELSAYPQHGTWDLTLTAEATASPEMPSYRTEDGATLTQGERAYDYYTMEPGTIGEPGGSDGWFDFHHDRGTRTLLNGQRICTLAFAKRRGFKGA